MTKQKKILAGIGIVFLIGATYFLYEYLMYVTTDDAQVDAHTLMLTPKVSGYILSVKVTEGQKVNKGDVLIEIDDRDYQNTLKQIKGEITSLEAQKTDAEKNYKRLSSLYSTGAVSQQQYDTSTAAFSQLKAKFEGMAAQVSQAEINLSNTKITAPSKGFIAKKSAEPGQLATPGIPLIGFVDAEERWITANFKETQISDIKVGNKVDISVDAIKGRSFEGKVDSISSATGATFTLLPPDNATGNFTKVVQRIPVKIKIVDASDDDVEHLRAGLSAEVKVHKY